MKALSETGKQALARVRVIDYHVNNNHYHIPGDEMSKLMKEREEKDRIYKQELRK